MENAVQGQAIPFWMDFPKRDALFVGARPAEGRQLALPCIGSWRPSAGQAPIPFWKVHPFLDGAFKKGIAWPQTAFPIGKKILIFLQ